MAAVHSSRQLPSNDPFKDPHRPPPPPPKMPAHNDITDAVRDTVTLRTSVDPRAKISRSQTAAQQQTGLSSSRPPNPKRSQTDDSANVDKPRSSGKSRSKKGSQHADVIDRLDFTGVGPMFHHDGPFDACAPSRNKHRNKAPLYAWGTGVQDDLASPQYGDSAYPSPNAYKAFTNDYPEPPKKKVDAIAEAWGIHEPEPFEEFFAGGGTGRPDGDTPASSIYNGKDSHQSNPRIAPSSRRKDSRDDARPRVAARRSLVPPPQPIFVDNVADIELPSGSPPLGSPPLGSPTHPKRNKSIMHRIRKMRDAPNVPVGSDYELPPASSSPTEANTATKPTHRPQNSFLGRFGGGGRANQLTSDKPEPFVYIEPYTNKDLPVPPSMGESSSGENGYFEGSSSSPSSGGLGRKSSLMKKVGRVVRGR